MSASAEASRASLTTGALARRLGVAQTTLRTWERRYGIGPSHREQGRHRRWSPEDVARLEHMCRLTAQGVTPAEAARLAMADDGRAPGRPTAAAPRPRAEGRTPGGFRDLPLGRVWPESRGLARAAVRLDASAVQAELRSAIDAYGIVVAWEQIIAPTLHAVGRKWSTSDESYVEVEHLLSWHVSATLRSAVTPAADSRRPILLACMPDEQHSLPIEALWAALTERGLPTRMFGAALPKEALHSAARRTGPGAVVLSSQSRGTADLAVVRALRTLEWGVRGARSHPLVLLAGPGWAGTTPEPGASRLTGLASGLALLESFFRTGAQPMPSTLSRR
ncbi:MerR family transcriptional regulator [Streptomyces cavernicola]|uniref:MerR family transcriptional regulator n=1 Tax=Streptomyces cavernicola TaxID=3043613 RepID=A0ABT6SL75_9ACTN|nr:MerR family transcriptional regulator [Streptomyces sp. B-S-A6]MDI3408946.1 MerR family transcriptional regulator [Streptomyces sp. B-S-A6]